MESRNLSCNRKKAVEELFRGRESAKELKDLLWKTSGTTDLALVEKILNSFANSIAMLSSGACGDQLCEVSRNLRIKSEDSGDSIKSSVRKDGRGSYKRKKHSQSCTKETSNLCDDGHSWRKYGQKEILKAKYPRSYFRCTHKYGQGCQATKQVQQMEDDPPKYHITYYGHHTCTNLLNASQLFLDSVSTDTDSSFLLSFETGAPAATAAAIKSDSPFFSSFSPVKMKYEDDMPREGTHHQSSSTISSDYLVSPEITSADHMMVLSSSGSDHVDIFSGVVDSGYFDDVFASF